MKRKEKWMDADLVAEKIENNGIDSFSDADGCSVEVSAICQILLYVYLT